MQNKFINVLVLGFGFMFLFTSFQTMGNIEKTVLDSIAEDDPSFKGDGYTSLAIIYAVFALCNWVAPSVLSICGPRGSMLIGAAAYCFFMVSFLWPSTILLYVASCVLGVGAALIWTGQGTYLTRCSNQSNISRNSGIFWAMLQASMFFGNTFVYFQFQGKNHIDKDTRQLVFGVLIAGAVVGVGFLLSLRRVRLECSPIDSELEVEQDASSNSSVFEAFRNAVRLFITRDMLLLSLMFLYTGLELSFFSGVYSPSIGFTLQLGEGAKQLVGMSGILIGVGEVSGGVLFGLMGSKTTKYGRTPIVVVGFIIHIVAFFLIYLNLPNDAPFGDTKEFSIFKPPQPSVALLCSLFLGFGDACFNTQIYSMLGSVYAKNSAAAFALFKFTQSVAAASGFVYSSHLGLRSQMSILLLAGAIGTMGFVLVEMAVRRRTDAQNGETEKMSS